jgi:hypothetical protein
MKLLFTTSLFLFFCYTGFGQAPQAFNYQAIARDASGNILANKQVGLQLSILDGSASGTVLYAETFTVTTNAFGLFTAAVGSGSAVSGTFSGVDWTSGNKYLKTDMDPTGGTTYTISGASQLLSVPYSLFAATAGSGTGSNWSAASSNIYNTNTGNVGIGITAPLAPLHVYSSSTAYSTEMLRLQAGNPYLSFYDNSGNYQGFLWKDGSNNMVLGTSCSNASGSVIMELNCNNNYTFAPSAALSINGITPQINFLQGGATAGSVSGSGSNLYISAFSPVSGLGAAAGNLILQYASSGSLGAHTAGYVGIGTQTPSNKLQIGEGSSSFSGNDLAIGNGTQAMSFFQSLTASTWYTNTNFALMPNGSPANLGIGTAAPAYALDIQKPGNAQINLKEGVGGQTATISRYTNRLEISPTDAFQISVGATAAPHFYINASGNVGIGTTDPQYSLSVNGTIQTKEVRVETGWADYVFEKKYQLRPLAEVEAYILQNSHLPDIPAASDIQKNGLAVGEIQTKMMEKIEELTLYVIELKKEIDQLKTMKNEKK